jgi:hypothetical protein
MGDTTLRELVYGKGAHVDPVACIEDIAAELAARTAAGYPHSIWQIVLHLNYWMDYDLSTVAGENRPYPEKAIESWSTPPSPAAEGRGADEAWQATTRRFYDLLTRLRRLAEWSERSKNWVRRSLLLSPPCMPCCGKLWRITVITAVRLPCCAGSLARGLLDVAVIPGDVRL